MRRAFVTGATGFLGLNLIESLLHRGWQVTALHLPGDDLGHLSRFHVEAVAADVLDCASVLRCMPERPDAVFHMAADTSTWPKHAERQQAVNVQGTANLCRVALERKAARFVYTSSSSAYGHHAERITEATPSNALTCGMSYHRSKYLAEQEVKGAVAEGLDAVILNPCNILGPYDTRNWAQLIRRVCQDRMPGLPPGIGTFAHARDVAAAHIAAAGRGRKGENYLLGGVEASFKQVIAEIAKIAGKELSISELSPRRLRLGLLFSTLGSFFHGEEPALTFPKYKRLVGRLSCDDSKAAAELGFATCSIPEMVADCHRWLQGQGLL